MNNVKSIYIFRSMIELLMFIDWNFLRVGFPFSLMESWKVLDRWHLVSFS